MNPSSLNLWKTTSLFFSSFRSSGCKYSLSIFKCLKDKRDCQLKPFFLYSSTIQNLHFVYFFQAVLCISKPVSLNNPLSAWFEEWSPSSKVIPNNKVYLGFLNQKIMSSVVSSRSNEKMYQCFWQLKVVNLQFFLFGLYVFRSIIVIMC